MSLQKKIVLLPFAIVLLVFFFFSPANTVASEKEEYLRARVVEVIEIEKEDEFFGERKILSAEIIKGPEKGSLVEVEVGGFFSFTEGQEFREGEQIVLVKTQGPDGPVYYFSDRYRIDALYTILGIFILLVVILGGIRGFSSFLGLAFSIFILATFVVPQIATGSNPLLASLMGAFIIAFVSLYLAHGFNKRTTIALCATLITLVFAALLSLAFVYWAKLFGMGSEEALFLRGGEFQDLDLRGLLLGGIIIGALGVLDDITTTQVATVEEISSANTKLKIGELYRKGISVGKEHIAALVNTLVLAYAGASFPLFLLFSFNRTEPLWFVINSEFIAEEIIRTLVGSSALIFAVPISTYLAARFVKIKK